MSLSLAFVALWTSPVQAECLTRPMSYDKGEEAPKDAPLYNLIEIPADEAASYKALGYGVASCTANASAGTVKIDGCAMVRFGNSAVQKRFATLLGVEPAKLCESTQRFRGKNALTSVPKN